MAPCVFWISPTRPSEMPSGKPKTSRASTSVSETTTTEIGRDRRGPMLKTLGRLTVESFWVRPR